MKPFQMKILRTWTALAIACTHLLSLSASAIAAAPSPVTAEFRLMESLIALEGEGLKPATFEKKAMNLVEQYDRTAPATGRAERLGDAVVELKALTLDQAKSLRVSVDQRSAEFEALDPSDSTARNELLASIIGESLGRHPLAGAQFSGCTWLWLGGSMILAAAIYGSVYITTMTQSSASSTTTGSHTETGTGSSSSGSTTISGSQTTTYASSTVTPNATLKKMLQVSTGIMYGVSAAMFITWAAKGVNYGC